jgi:hypothetical protein
MPDPSPNVKVASFRFRLGLSVSISVALIYLSAICELAAAEIDVQKLRRQGLAKAAVCAWGSITSLGHRLELPLQAIPQ